MIARSVCPACSQHAMFKGLVSFYGTCPNCGWNYADQDIGDGAVYICVLVLSVLIGACATYVSVNYAPPLWVHAALCIPLTLILCIISLRICRAWLMRVIYDQTIRDQQQDKDSI